MKLKRSVECSKVPPAVAEEWARPGGSLSLLKSYVRNGGDLEQVSLEVMQKKLRSQLLEDLYSYVTRSELESKYSRDETTAIIQECMRRGGRHVRPHPAAPTVATLTQYWVLKESTGVNRELVEQHLRFFANAAVTSDSVDRLLESMSMSGFLRQVYD
jgi:hypothetical protein